MIFLANVFEKQSELVKLNLANKHELQVVKNLHKLPTAKQKRFHELTKELLVSFDQPHDLKTCAEKSRILREEGNRLYTSKVKRKPHEQPECLLNACRMYTQAIFSAENAHEELCLAFANRGMALQDYGYYEQAYDDCESALEFGYPKRLQHKLIMRQAHCAWQLGDAEKLAKHLACLEELHLNSGYAKQLEQLQQQLTLLQDTHSKDGSMVQPELVTESNHKIESGARGRHMLATKRLDTDELIFTERALCFVPIKPGTICQQCAASLLCAPIPCTKCHQRVIYCSRRCRDLDAHVHSYECAGYRGDIFACVGISHLALRMVISFMPQWLPLLGERSNADQMWQTLMSIAKTKHDWPAAPQHVLSLSMIHHLAKMDESEVFYYLLCVNLMQAYLRNCTKFYEQVLQSNSGGTAASGQDWDMLISALLLRSCCQLLANAHVEDAILASEPSQPNHPVLLEPQLWREPYHLRLGHLHRFSKMMKITALNLPYLALCNHACAPNVRLKGDGMLMRCHALHPIKPGEQIFNCYTADYRSSLCAVRQQELKKTFKFQCSCSKCVRRKPDQEFMGFHRMRCEQSKCGHIFVPVEELDWFTKSETTLSCPKCRAPQELDWFHKLMERLRQIYEADKRRKAFKAFEELNTWLLGYHVIKLNVAKEFVEQCLAARAAGAHLDDTDYEHLGRIVDWQLAGVAAMQGKETLIYITRLTSLLDLIALGKYKCSGEQLAEIRMNLNVLPSDTKRVFVNYYNDFIEQQGK